MDYARDPNSLAPCRSYEASDDHFDASEVAVRRLSEYDDYSFPQRFMVGLDLADIDTAILPPEWVGASVSWEDPIPRTAEAMGASLDSLSDADLPGCWSRADFLGGDPDERSHAQRDLELGRQQIPTRGQE